MTAIAGMHIFVLAFLNNTPILTELLLCLSKLFLVRQSVCITPCVYLVLLCSNESVRSVCNDYIHNLFCYFTLFIVRLLVTLQFTPCVATYSPDVSLLCYFTDMACVFDEAAVVNTMLLY